MDTRAPWAFRNNIRLTCDSDDNRLFCRPQNSATRKALQNTIVACNSLAMSALGRGNTARCKELLAKALEVAYDRRSQHHSSPGHDDDLDGEANRDASVTDAALQVLTLNNTACLHRRCELCLAVRSGYSSAI